MSYSIKPKEPKNPNGCFPANFKPHTLREFDFLQNGGGYNMAMLGKISPYVVFLKFGTMDEHPACPTPSVICKPDFTAFKSLNLHWLLYCEGLKARHTPERSVIDNCLWIQSSLKMCFSFQPQAVLMHSQHLLWSLLGYYHFKTMLELHCQEAIKMSPSKS